MFPAYAVAVSVASAWIRELEREAKEVAWVTTEFHRAVVWTDVQGWRLTERPQTTGTPPPPCDALTGCRFEGGEEK